jgi:hypothetical protein
MTDNRRPPANSHPPNTLTLYVSGPHGIPRTQAPQVHPHKAVTYTSALRLSRVHPRLPSPPSHPGREGDCRGRRGWRTSPAAVPS